MFRMLGHAKGPLVLEDTTITKMFVRREVGVAMWSRCCVGRPCQAYVVNDLFDVKVILASQFPMTVNKEFEMR